MARGFFRRGRVPEQPAAAPAGEAAADRPVRRADGGWRSVRPLGPTVQRLATMSDGLRFRDGLSAWQNPSQRIEMGHAVSAEAPTGLTAGLVRTGARSARAPQPGLPQPVVYRVPPESDAEYDEPSASGAEAAGHGQAAEPTPVSRRAGTAAAPVAAARDSATGGQSFVETPGPVAGTGRSPVPRGRLTVARSADPVRRLPVAPARTGQPSAARPTLGTWTAAGEPAVADRVEPARTGPAPALPVATGPAPEAAVHAESPAVPAEVQRATTAGDVQPASPASSSSSSSAGHPAASPAAASPTSVQRSAAGSDSPAPAVPKSTSDDSPSSPAEPGIGAPLTALPSTALFIAGDRRPDESSGPAVTPNRPLLPRTGAIQRLASGSTGTEDGAARAAAAPEAARLPVVSGERDTPDQATTAPPPAAASERAASITGGGTPVHRAAAPSASDGPVAGREISRSPVGEPMTGLPATAKVAHTERATDSHGDTDDAAGVPARPTTAHRPLLPESATPQRLAAHPGATEVDSTGQPSTVVRPGVLPVVAGRQPAPDGRASGVTGSSGGIAAGAAPSGEHGTPVRSGPGAPAGRANRVIPIARMATAAAVRMRGLLSQRPLVPESGSTAGGDPGTGIGPLPVASSRSKVVPARWAGDAERPVTGASGPAATDKTAATSVQRAAAGPNQTSATDTPAARSRPVRRSHTGSTAPGSWSGSAAHLPASAPNWPSRQGALLADAPAPGRPAADRLAVASGTAGGQSSAPPVPVRWVPPPAPSSKTSASEAPAAYTAVQRSPDDAKSSVSHGTGGTTTAVTAQEVVTESGGGQPDARREEQEYDERGKTEELTQQIVDTVMRLMRAELRFGKERSGRLHQRRR
ncbi:hypothetical protein [Amycolatopsis minnesotensis]|uniref:Syndecan 1 n=1 Tax=Amycolatopsis minnesotensis TaxID=337894 RepID=A0ABP5BQW7_9PSEU